VVIASNRCISWYRLTCDVEQGATVVDTLTFFLQNGVVTDVRALHVTALRVI
jgi:hypothetical protein